jgi:NADH-ubiquinone oxidoreductase chain 4
MLSTLFFIPLLGIFILFSSAPFIAKDLLLDSSILGFIVSGLTGALLLFTLFDLSCKQMQFVEEFYQTKYIEFFLGLSGISIYFVILTTIVVPMAILSNWKSIEKSVVHFLLIIVALQAALLLVFLILDVLIFYVFFECILAPLFILIGIFGSHDKVRACYYIFLYTLLGSLFMLLSVVIVLSLMGGLDLEMLWATIFEYRIQLFVFYGIFIAFAVKTPVIYLNNWLLRAHVESPLSGSVVLAAIVLKLSLYGIVILILPFLFKAFVSNTYFIFSIGVLTIMYASLSTIRTIDVKELIAYSSVSHAAVYLLGVFSNVLLGIQGAITLGIAHGFVSSGLFISAGGILYDRTSTRLITCYRGMAQGMPIFSILFFILCLGNCGVPLTINFIGEFLSLYGVFERLPIAGGLASLSIIFSAAYTIFMFNRIAFAGAYIRQFCLSFVPDLNKREFYLLLIFTLFTLLLGLYPAPLLDGLHYITYSLMFIYDSNTEYFQSLPEEIFESNLNCENPLDPTGDTSQEPSGPSGGESAGPSGSPSGGEPAGPSGGPLGGESAGPSDGTSDDRDKSQLQVIHDLMFEGAEAESKKTIDINDQDVYDSYVECQNGKQLDKESYNKLVDYIKKSNEDNKDN